MANRLAQSTSPYLRQHANNPVDWFEWGAEAFREAERREVPIFLSIGYAACHWCHVMAHESFEDPSTAAVMNEKFVCVKVDREERPDVDSVYMDVVTSLTGHGGWPMTVFCAPDGSPFWGGTYFPPEPRHGMPSFRQVLEAIHDAWLNQRDDIRSQSAELHKKLSSIPVGTSSTLEDVEEVSLGRLEGAFDSEHGGFGGPPKFPQAPVLELAIALRAGGHNSTHAMIQTTLGALAHGGIRDQIGGGFARYAVDATWTVPHFEKMLYDNAQLLRVFTRAHRTRGDVRWPGVIDTTAGYLLNELRDSTGGFHASEDADSEGEEGTFYVWSYDEFMDVAPDAAEYFGVTRGGNFEGKNVLTSRPDMPYPTQAAARLLEARSRRVRPGRDDKILTSWNGLTIGALAEAGRAFNNGGWVDAARECAEFILGEMRPGRGNLLHTFRDGEARIDGLLEDYAYLADGLWWLYTATFDRRWLDVCFELTDEAFERFEGPHGTLRESDVEQLFVTKPDITESATPSAAATLCETALKIAVLTDSDRLTTRVDAALAGATPYMERAPLAVPTWTRVQMLRTRSTTEIVFSPGAYELEQAATQVFVPGVVVARTELDVALTRGRSADTPTAWVCRNRTCDLGDTTTEGLLETLRG